MPSHYCVPECTFKGYWDAAGGKISFFNFPKDAVLHKKWIHLIQRVPRKEFHLTSRTKVCSRHFKTTDMTKSPNGIVKLKPGSFPSIFAWSVESPRKRKSPTKRHKPPRPSTTSVKPDLEASTSESVNIIPEPTLEELFIEAKKDKERLEEQIRDIQSQFVELQNENRRLLEINKQIMAELQSEIFKKYPKTRVIIDCTEIRYQMPSGLLLNSELFSSYKNHVTFKALIGIAPNGAITSISQLYTGSISDREIGTRSGLLDLKFDDGDSVMADKSFTIEDILPLGVTINYPPFLGAEAQMLKEDVIETQQIASVRIHIERAINLIKNYHIWDGEVPLTLIGLVNQMWTVCAFLCYARDPLISV